MFVIVLTFDNCDPEVHGSFHDRATAERYMATLEALDDHHCQGGCVVKLRLPKA